MRAPAAVGLAASLLVTGPRTTAPDIVQLLDRYERGEFEAVAREMAAIPPPPRYWGNAR